MTAPKFDLATQDAIGNYWHDVADQIERLVRQDKRYDDYVTSARRSDTLTRESAHRIAYGYNMGVPAAETAALIYDMRYVHIQRRD